MPASSGKAARVLDSRLMLWAVLAFPGIYYLQGYWRETLFYGEVVHASGVLATRILLLTLALTPLALVFPRARWVIWLKRRRRYFGVAAFAYALLHAVVYLERQATFARIAADLREAAMWTGWVALIAMLALAVTSNDWSVRRLGRRWRTLHRAVHAAALLTFAHWILSAFDPVPGYVHFAVYAGLVALRWYRPRRARCEPPAGA